jgi:hypothetical protein
MMGEQALLKISKLSRKHRLPGLLLMSVSLQTRPTRTVIRPVHTASTAGECHEMDSLLKVCNNLLSPEVKKPFQLLVLLGK